MPSTPNLALPYPGLTDAPNAPSQVQALALALDAIMATQAAALLFTNAANFDTPTSGTATWLTLGNITVPAWATKVLVTYSINGFYATGAGGGNASAVVKIGSTAGAVSRRIVGEAGPSLRMNLTVTDLISAPAAGSNSVTIASTFTAGTVYRHDTQSTTTASFIFIG